MNYRPLLRDHRQMVRIVGEQSNNAISFALASAYGDKSYNAFDAMFCNHINPTEAQIRLLDSMGLASTSIRAPSQPAIGGQYSARETSILYHQLNNQSRDYINGQHGGQMANRHSSGPGTKFRTELGQNGFIKMTHQRSSNATMSHHHPKSADQPVYKAFG